MSEEQTTTLSITSPPNVRHGICAECGQPFSWVGGGQGKHARRYCDKCWRKVAARKKSQTMPRRYVPCEVCGTPFYKPPSSNKRYCSKTCYGKTRAGKANPRPQNQMPTIYRGGIRPDLGHYCRSSWEANFARVLKHRGIPYRYEPKVFILERPDGTETSYRPDFGADGSFYEVKGRLLDRDAEKIALFREQHPDLPLTVIDGPAYHALRRRYRDEIPAWEAQHIDPVTLRPPACEACGKSCAFPTSRFCSRQCSNRRYRKPAAELSCERCGMGFSVQPYRAETARYCSRKCAEASPKRLRVRRSHGSGL